MRDSTLTQERLKELLHYDPETGVFTWAKTKGSRAVAGTPAGWFERKGYRNITLDGKHYKAHRLAWLYTHGHFPTLQLDHRNEDKDDNRIGNLREVSNQVNHFNKSKPLSKNPYLGVSFDSNRSKWKAQIKVNGKGKLLGRFETPEQARAAYMAAKSTHHPINTL